MRWHYAAETVWSVLSFSNLLSKYMGRWIDGSGALHCKEVNVTYEMTKVKENLLRADGPSVVVESYRCFSCAWKTSRQSSQGRALPLKERQPVTFLEINHLSMQALENITYRKKWQVHPSIPRETDITNSGEFFQRTILKVFWKNKLYSTVTQLIPFC